MKLLLLTLALIAGTDFLPHIVRLTGASCEEDLAASEIERFEALAAHPLDINRSGRRELIASGLFSAYQAATIRDYIDRNGDICSIAELAVVDGIGGERARDLAPFVRLEPQGQLGAVRRARLRSDAMARVGWRSGVRTDAEKVSVSYGGVSAAAALKNGSLTTAHLGVRGRRLAVTAGDFNARYGQGLLVWTGFTMSTFYTPGAFVRSPTGISGSTTLSEVAAKRGLAAQFARGSFDLSAFATLEGEQLAHVGYLTRRGSYGLTFLHSPVGTSFSTDWRVTLRKFTLFGELASLRDTDKRSPAVRTGAFYNIAYGKRAGLLVRAGSDEHGIALGAETRGFSLTVDASENPLKEKHQLKTILLCNPSFPLGPVTLQPAVRLNSRYRPEETFQWRNDLRAELDLSSGPWMVHFRFNAVRCEEFSWLWYLEGGWKEGKSAVYLRGGLFKADKWNDRIYVYERDTPGSFNVPAYYGRGWMCSLCARWRSLALRAATTRYPWMPDKSPRYELKLQVNLKYENKRKADNLISNL